MNTSKQVNVMIGTVFLAFLMFTGYMVNEANRQHVAREEITHRIAERGARLYVNNCRGCHGMEGEGHVAPALQNKAFLILGPENQYGAEATPQGEADAVHSFLFNTITCGRTNTFMPTWGQRFGGPLTDTAINQLVTMITEGRWDVVREIAAEHDPALYAELVAGIKPQPPKEQLDAMPRDERRAFLAERDEQILEAQEALRAQIEHGDYPAVMKKEVLVADASTLALTEKNCGQFTADTAADIKGRDPTVAAAVQATPGAGGGTPAPTAAAGSPAALGKTLATSQGCAACHNTGGQPGGVGPTWKGLAGSSVALADGSTVTADDAFLHESIVAPDAKIVKGYAAGLMPKTFGTSLTPAQIDALVEYIKTIK